MGRTRTLFSVALVVCVLGQLDGQSPDIVMHRLMDNMRIKDACAFIEKDQDRIARESASLERPQLAAQFAEMLKREHMTDVHVDSEGNVLGLSYPEPDQALLAVVAHIRDPKSLAALLAVIRALNDGGLQTKNGILIVATRGTSGSENNAIGAVLQESRYKERIHWFVAVNALEEGRIFMAPKTIGSTIVQLALQAAAAVGLKPRYEEGLTDLEAPVALRIPSVAIGVGGLKGIQVALATILAVAEIR